MSERAIHVGVLAAALALAAWMFVQDRSAHAPPRSVEASAVASPLSIIPPGSAFVLTADVAQLRHAQLGPMLAERFFVRLGSGAGDLTGLCGFDPLSALDQVALAVPSAGLAPSARDGDFGVVATGHFSAAQISRCASAAIKARGGDPVSTELGAFSSVRDRNTEGGEVAARDGGPLIVSGGSYFRALLDAAAGNGAKPEHQDARDAEHAKLRQLLGSGTIVATWLLSEGWLERVSGESDARLSPLTNLRALGARLDVSRVLQLSVLLECADAASAAKIDALLKQLRSSLDALPLDSTLRGVAQRISPVQEGARLRLNLALSEPELRALLDMLGPAAPSRASDNPLH